VSRSGGGVNLIVTIQEELEMHPSLLQLLSFVALREGYHVEYNMRRGFRSVSIIKMNESDLAFLRLATYERGEGVAHDGP